MWDCWRIFLADDQGFPLKEFKFKTPKGSTSFANPNISLLHDYASGDPLLVASYFMPGEGNAEQEFGDVVYAINIPKIEKK